jgi:hypothetical protein
VLRDRRVPAERLDTVARHYELFGGVSPLTAITRRQVDGLKGRLDAAGVDVPVYLGMRNWHPLLPDVLRTMAHDGVRRAIGFVCAPHRSYSSCTQYRQNIVDARAEFAGAGLLDVAVTYVGDWHADQRFIDANASHVRTALAEAAQPRRRTTTRPSLHLKSITCERSGTGIAKKTPFTHVRFDVLRDVNTDMRDAANFHYTLSACRKSRRGCCRRPEWMEGLMLQNTNAYKEGFTAAWNRIRDALCKNPGRETEAPLLPFLSVGINSGYFASKIHSPR